MAVSGLLGRGNLFGLDLDLETADEIYAGIETLVIVRLKNRRRHLPACLLRFEIAGGAAVCPVLLPAGELRLPLPVTFPRRGQQPLKEIRVSSPFPINFFVRSIVLPVVGTATVFPAPRAVPRLQRDGARHAAGEVWQGKGYEGELTRIGDYLGHEPLKMIHWKLSARHGQLKVKELSSAAAPPLLVDPARLPGRGLEERLEAACWLIDAASREGRPVGLQLDAASFPAAVGRSHKLTLLGELARYGHSASAP
ncbi:hypothetical protein DBW_0644 [Desulfuromonas sp. DDH964]|uniref:DUF58 domain-containing protein n=1 Tax=Desulfuromonas sp. DDH964 TaxID=1823759 RepID=UPI00078C2F92|nr:DUF58 domain-containing protein [Desulfuromonas sp. DDH964]AMV71035.1 hypothetical protein DBW_0644 [Desulfuromonas sp. DDH964]